ncbi:FtsX-like permease family protein [Haloplasma contractile]|uniref:ABC transporter ATP-binding-permease protein n=1 Tax=Haloplasma contractile SSD-17B TaxID=1033810 RepID=F7PRI9_9MOLU|nr:ABC transporter permease [Haloplasma contractile]ERJ11684.1 ABC transporter ATP-binding-permease protein [Haloplasma contractile SSD-17B]
MLKPLSYLTYFKGNIKKSMSLILSIAFSIVLLGSIHMFITNSINTGTIVSRQSERYTIINGVEKPISEFYLNKIKGNEDIDQVIPVEREFIEYMGVAIAGSCHYYKLNREDIIYLMDVLGIDYDNSQIPLNDSNKLIIHQDILVNNDLDIQDTYEETIDHNLLTIDLTFQGDYLVGFVPKTIDRNERHNTYIVIPKEGKLEEVNHFLNSEADTNIAVQDVTFWEEIYDRILGDVNNLFDIITVVVVIIIGIGLGISTYVHYFQRRKEFGILLSIGYKHRSILMRINKEILITSVLSFVLGLSILLIELTIMNYFIISDEGLPLFEVDLALLSKICFIPLFTSVFSLVPTWVLLKKIDSISIIEGVN